MKNFRMWSARLSKYATVISIGCTGYFFGTYYERSKQRLTESRSPAIFSNVFAATPLTPATLGNNNASRISEMMKYGFPGLDNIRSFDNFVLSYDRKTRVAHWVFEHFTKESIKFNEGVNRALCEFQADKSIHHYFRSENTDYKGSGYDRGHLAAAGNHKASQKDIEQTFLLSNMAPQVGVGFNRHSWNRLEKYVRKKAKVNNNVYCCTGPLYLPRKESDGKKYVKYEVIGANNVAVPTHFFKVVLFETTNGILELEAYVMPNQAIDDAIPLTSFQVPPDSIERAAGLLFFDNIGKTKISRVNGKNI